LTQTYKQSDIKETTDHFMETKTK